MKVLYDNFSGKFQDMDLYVLRNDLSSIDLKDYKILAVADVGLWYGRRTGYRIYENLQDVFYSECDSVKWYIQNSSLKYVGYHHDGTNYATYYLIPKEHGRGVESILDDLYNNVPVNKSRIYRHCKPLGKIILKHLGG